MFLVVYAIRIRSTYQLRDIRLILTSQNKQICHLHISHDTPCLPPNILHSLCFFFFISPGKLQSSQEKLEDNTFAKFWGANMVYYGRWANGKHGFTIQCVFLKSPPVCKGRLLQYMHIQKTMKKVQTRVQTIAFLVHTYLFLSSSLAYNNNIHISIPADLSSSFLMLWIHNIKKTTNSSTMFKVFIISLKWSMIL